MTTEITAGLSRDAEQRRIASSPRTTPPWLQSYLRRLTATDTLAVVVSVVVAQVVRFGTDQPALTSLTSSASYSLVSGVLVVAWLTALRMFGCRDPRVVGAGAEEYRRVAHASAALFGTVAVLAFLLEFQLARGYLAVALPAGLFALLLSRWCWRQRLFKERLRGRCMTTVLVVGSHRSATAMAETFEQAKGAGYRVAGVCVPGGRGAGEHVNLRGHAVPVFGDEESVLEALRLTGADMVAVSNAEVLGGQGMRSLAWQLESVDVDLVVSAGVIDVAGPRLQIRPVAGLPVLHVDKPQYRRAHEFGKMAFDYIASAIGVLVLSPVFALVAVAVKLDSPGSVLYRAERIGLNGTPFHMLKFRSMVTDAESRRGELLGANQGAGPLFKMRDDPRVTRVGRWLRRLSMDELPQLVNVLRGQMSLVGPRPPLAVEVATYTGEMRRRLLVKPGITGLWQVSGRSNLSWDESVRLDLFYVENWSMIQDVIILWKTLGAVSTSRGAY